ncbi:MAG TPA: enoyl-CoA hydratase/isomerase family protein [Candidatus Dormibacteraeota bacterium]
MTGQNMTVPAVRTDLDADGVLRVTLDRPQKRNALDAEMFTALGEAFGARAHADHVRCVVLRGAGPAFCAGLDRGILAGLGDGAEGDIGSGGRRLQAVFDAMEACPRPTLAVVQGACVGGGFALALACDLRIAARDAFFSMMEMRYAFLPDLGHLHRLQREVGMARAKEALFFGDRIYAATLLAWGVLNAVVDPGELDAAAQTWAARCRAAAPLAVREAKRLLQADPGGHDGAASQTAALRANVDLLRTEDFREGLAAAMGGRPPDFLGR